MHSLLRKMSIIVAIAVVSQYAIASDLMNYNIPSAQIADMFRYGNVETSLFTGRLNLSIPLYQLEDPDLSFNIDLRYNAEGFKPFKHSGFVGYSWFLETGGCITREVRNYADETCRKDQQSNDYMMGMLYFIRRGILDKFKVFDFDPSVCKTCYIGSNNTTLNLGDDCHKDADYLPDIFHFNFCGYHGSFMIDNSGNPVILTGDFMKIDLSALSELAYSTAPNNSQLRPLECTEITLTSKDGYQYVFGGDITSVGYTLSLTDNNQWAVQNPPVITAWYLRKVIAPNHRQITFYYKSPTTSSGFSLTDPLLEMNQYHDIFAQYDYFPDTAVVSNPIRKSMTKTCILDSIVIPGAQPLRVSFYSKMDSHSLYLHPAYGQGDRPYMLDSIHVSSGDRILRRVLLSYEYQSYQYNTTSYAHYWRFLQNIYISGVGTYSLHYDNTIGTYPSLLTTTSNSYYSIVDYYGYRNGVVSGGLLNRIDFPTGGKQEFTYECHNCSKQRRYIATGATRVDMETVNTAVQNLSGVRIKEIKTFTNSTDLAETKQYSYLPAPYSSFSGSSGIYYNNRLVYLPTNYIQGFMVTDANTYSLLDTHIGYSYVEETAKDATNTVLSKIGYTFDVGKDYDTSYSPDINILTSIGNSSTINVHAAFSGMLFYNSKLTNVGHLLAKDYFNGDRIIHSELYRYNHITSSPTHLIPENKGQLGCTDTIVVFSHRALPVARKLYVYPDPMQQYVTIDYDEGGFPTFTNRCYLYDNKLRIKKEYLKNQQSEWLFTAYTYPDDCAVVEVPPISRFSSVSNPLYILKHQHRINIPLETVSGYEDVNGDEYITGGKLNLYKAGTKIFHMDSIVGYAYLNRVMELSVEKPITDYRYLGFSIEVPIYDNRYHLACRYEYNFDLRPILISPYGKIPTTFTWDGIYPFTKTIGNQVCTYTFIPYVGISSYTNERGITTYYDYDANGRLTEVFQMNDGRKEILNAYQYHVKTE